MEAAACSFCGEERHGGFEKQTMLALDYNQLGFFSDMMPLVMVISKKL